MTQWDDELWLLTPLEFDQIPNGVELTSILNKTLVKGRDYFDIDTRGGHLAYGIKDPWNHQYKHLFLTFILKS